MTTEFKRDEARFQSGDYKFEAADCKYIVKINTHTNTHTHARMNK